MAIQLNTPLAEKAVNTIRFLVVDAVEAAGCGHPGLPMGAADFALTLWSNYLHFDPADPEWVNRDRFVLSAGHGSMLLYSLLHLYGYDLPLDALKKFRQLGSKTPGHPEYGMTPGVETTTGPLGQGFANGVGMGIASKMLAERFNTDAHTVIDNRVYVLCSDGDLMEGISHEAASLAGHLKLGNLIYYYDDNQITIEGSTDLAYSDDVQKRFEAYGWHVQKVDAHDRQAVAKAIEAAQAEGERPSILIARSHIGFGSPNLQGTAEVHGAAMGAEEALATRKNLAWPVDGNFLVPDDVREMFDGIIQEKTAGHEAWKTTFAAWRDANPDLAEQFDALMAKRAPADLTDQLLAGVEPKTTGTRKASQAVLQVAADLVPSLVGGSADLAPSTNTILEKYGHINTGEFGGRNVHYGVREHAMGAVNNGIAAGGGFIPYGATFLVFADYMRPTLRLAAIMGVQSIFVFTHDSIFVGEDGPTHQAVEQVASLRMIPNLHVIRPCGVPEAAVAWAQAIERTDGPTALIFTRQNVPALDPETVACPKDLKKGAYIISPESGEPEAILIASGSEVPLAIEAQAKLAEDGLSTRVVSMPCEALFEEQDQTYRDAVLPPACTKRVAIEAGTSFGWHRYIGADGLAITVDRFGESGPYKKLEEVFGFTADQVCDKVRAYVGGND